MFGCVREGAGGSITDEEEADPTREAFLPHYHVSISALKSCSRQAPILGFLRNGKEFVKGPSCIFEALDHVESLHPPPCHLGERSLFGIYIGLNDENGQTTYNFAKSTSCVFLRSGRGEAKWCFLSQSSRKDAEVRAAFYPFQKTAPDVGEERSLRAFVRWQALWYANAGVRQKAFGQEEELFFRQTEGIKSSMMDAYDMQPQEKGFRLGKCEVRPGTARVERKLRVLHLIWILICCANLIFKMESRAVDNLIFMNNLLLLLMLERVPSEEYPKQLPYETRYTCLNHFPSFVVAIKNKIVLLVYMSQYLVRFESDGMAFLADIQIPNRLKDRSKANPKGLYPSRELHFHWKITLHLSETSITRNKKENSSHSQNDWSNFGSKISLEPWIPSYKMPKVRFSHGFLLVGANKTLLLKAQDPLLSAEKANGLLAQTYLFKKHKRKDVKYEAFRRSRKRIRRRRHLGGGDMARVGVNGAGECYFGRTLWGDVRGCGLRWSTLLQLGTLLFLIGFFNDFASAVCPMACTCKWKDGKQTVECVNKGLDAIPKEIDPGTQVLDLRQNPLVIIPQQKFKINGLTNLQRIFASECKLFQLDDTAFYGLSNLIELDLSKNELRMIPAMALQDLTALMRLQLSNNPIKEVRDYSFRRLEYLILLDMSSCDIERIEPFGFQGLDKLEWLKIQNNKISTVPHNIVLPKSLLGIELHNNPWNCDCSLKKLQDWMILHSAPAAVEPKCTKPIRLRFKLIRNIEPQQFACLPEVRPTSLFLDVLEGKNVSFECHVNSIPEAVISWNFNGKPLENTSFLYDETTSLYVFEEKDLNQEKVSFLHIETVTEAHNGIFQCGARNLAGRTTSNFTLRVSVQSTTQPPEVIVIDRAIYIGVAIAMLALIIFILLCLLIIRWCRRQSRNSKRKPNINISISNSVREKDGTSRPRTGNMPKYIQMGTPAPKINGILDCSPISVIETSPYRTEQTGTIHMNPDIIADGPNDRNKAPKKKVSIVGVEEMDPSGVRTTRRLDDILEETEDTFDQNYEKLVNKNPYDITVTTSKEAYTDLHRQLASYPLANIHPSETPPPQYFEQQTLPLNFQQPRDKQNWQDTNEHLTPIPQEQPPIYATIKRNRRSPSPRADLLHDQKYPEHYNIPPCDNQFRPPDSRYQQNYAIPPKNPIGENQICDCCQTVPVHSEILTSDSLGRIRGDGCSFDNLLSSCGGHCCYNQQTGHLFDNSLPENYRPLEPNPPPPAGYGDSEDEDATQKDWEEDTLSPGTRVLYSPDENYRSELVNQTSITDSTSDA